MKKGKTSKLNGFKNCKAFFGTVDSKEFKSIYLNLQTWVQPKKEIEKTNRIVSLLNKDIKSTISNSIDTEYFKNNFIVDLDLRHSGIFLGKKSFLNLEVTVFVNEKINDFKSQILKKKLESIAKNIYDHNFNKNEYFEFNLSKR